MKPAAGALVGQLVEEAERAGGELDDVHARRSVQRRSSLAASSAK